MNGFNWGAFFLTFIWGAFNGVYYLLFLIPVFLLIGMYLPTVPSAFIHLIIFVVLGIKGNDLAYNAKKWKNIEEFEHVQKKWAKLGLIAWIIIAVYFVISAIIQAMGTTNLLF